MVVTIALLVLGVIQIFTAIGMFFSYKQTGNTFYGIHAPHIENLNINQSIFRYMLTALWISVSVIYFVGAVSTRFTLAACLLAVVNTVLEVVGYWAGNIPRWIPIGGTIVFGAIAIICSLYLISM